MESDGAYDTTDSPGYSHPVHVEGGEGEIIPVYISVHVDQPQHEALIAAARVLQDAVQIPERRDGNANGQN